MEVELAGAADVLFEKRPVEELVALEDTAPVTCTAVPVAATPAAVPVGMLDVLLAKRPIDDDVVAFAGEDERPVANAEPEDVTFAGDPVMIEEFVDEFADACHVKGGLDEGLLEIEVHSEVVGSIEDMASEEVVLGGYAVLPSTLVGMGRLVILVR